MKQTRAASVNTTMKRITFSIPMVEAILRGRKTQTRRTVSDNVPMDNMEEALKRSKYGIGDILAVAEPWRTSRDFDHLKPSELPDDARIWHQAEEGEIPGWCGKPRLARFMMTKHARIFLKVTQIRIQRLQDICWDDAIAEGIDIHVCPIADTGDFSVYPRNYMISEKEADGWPYFKEDEYVKSFQSLWASIYGQESWEQNPFVWVFEFERVNP